MFAEHVVRQTPLYVAFIYMYNSYMYVSYSPLLPRVRWKWVQKVSSMSSLRRQCVLVVVSALLQMLLSQLEWPQACSQCVCTCTLYIYTVHICLSSSYSYYLPSFASVQLSWFFLLISSSPIFISSFSYSYLIGVCTTPPSFTSKLLPATVYKAMQWIQRKLETAIDQVKV